MVHRRQFFGCTSGQLARSVFCFAGMTRLKYCHHKMTPSPGIRCMLRDTKEVSYPPWLLLVMQSVWRRVFVKACVKLKSC